MLTKVHTQLCQTWSTARLQMLGTLLLHGATRNIYSQMCNIK